MQPNMKNNRMSGEEIKEMMGREDVGVISMIGIDGFPYAVPVNFVVIDGDIYIHGRRSGDKIDDLKANPNVCFTVWHMEGYEDYGISACSTTTVYESVVIRGISEFVEDSSEKTGILMALVSKLTPDKLDMDVEKIPPTTVCRIIPVSVTGKYHRPSTGNNVRHRG